jgi:hypothetical protein
VLIPVCFAFIQASPGFFPDDYLAYAGQLLYWLSVLPRELNVSDDFCAELFKCILVGIQVPNEDLVSVDLPSEAVAGMAFYQNGSIDVSLPRPLARGLFLDVFQNEDRLPLVLEFLSQCGYSEGLIHLLYSLRCDGFPPLPMPPVIGLILSGAFELIPEMPPFPLLSYLRTLARYVDILPPDAVEFVREKAHDLVTTYYPGSPAGFEAVPFTIGVEMLVDLMEHQIAPMEDERSILLAHAEATIVPVGLKGLGYISESGEESCVILQRCCLKMISLLTEFQGQHLLADEAAIEVSDNMLRHIQRPGVIIPWEDFANLVRCLADGEREVSLAPSYDVLALAVCGSGEGVVAFAEFFISHILGDYMWEPFEDNITSVLLCLTVHHADVVASFVPAICERVLLMANDQGEHLPIESLVCIIRLLSGLIQVGLLDDDRMQQSMEWLAGYAGIYDESIYRHCTIQLIGPAFLAGHVEIPEEILSDWLDLVKRGWFSTRYLLALSLLCFKKITESGSHPVVDAVYQMLLSREFPDYPGGGDADVLMTGFPSMPIEADVADWLQTARQEP